MKYKNLMSELPNQNYMGLFLPTYTDDMTLSTTDGIKAAPLTLESVEKAARLIREEQRRRFQEQARLRLMMDCMPLCPFKPIYGLPPLLSAKAMLALVSN